MLKEAQGTIFYCLKHFRNLLKKHLQVTFEKATFFTSPTFGFLDQNSHGAILSACSSIDLCLTCWDAQMTQASNECTCNFGFYASSSTACSACNSGCKTCSASDLCLTCWDTNMIESGNVCTCSSGYYYDSTSKTCIACNSG